MKRLALSLAIAFGLLMGLQALGRNSEVSAEEGATTGKTILTYQVSVPDAAQKRIFITGVITGLDAPSLTLARPWAWASELPNIANLAITDAAGRPLAYDLSVDGDAGNDGHHRYTISSTTNVHTIRFSYTIDMASIVGSQHWQFVPGEYALAESQFLFLQPLSTTLNDLTMTFELPSSWEPVSRLFATDDYFQAIVSDTVSYGNPEETYYLWGPIGLGRFDISTDTVGEVEFVVAVSQDDVALGSDIAASRFAVNRYASRNLWPLGNGATPQRYINLYPISGDAYVSARDHCHGDFRSIFDANELYERQRELTHVTLHEWFLHGGLDYPQWDVLHPEMWAEEGLNDYFGVRIAHESGVWTDQRANAEWLSMYQAYAANLVGSPYDVPLAGDVLWALPEPAWSTLWYKKGALVNHLLDYQVGEVTGGAKSIEDVFRFLHEHVPSAENKRVDVADFLLAYNLVTGRDFTSFFDAYITGTTLLPFIIDNGKLQIDDALLPETPRLDPLSLVRLAAQVELADTDGDGLSDWGETLIGTDLAIDDTDRDGISDRAEFGVVVDGLSGEYGMNMPIVIDPLGDSSSMVAGTDIVGLYASVFRNEDSVDWLYLALREANSDYNPDAWYELHITTPSNLYQFRFEAWNPFLWREEEGGGHVEISEGRIEASFRDHLEVLIPLGLFEDPEVVSVRGSTRFGPKEDPSWGLKTVDETDWGEMSTRARMFITDPLNSDTDRDGIDDGIELQLGSDPTDTDDVLWPIYLPTVLMIDQTE